MKQIFFKKIEQVDTLIGKVEMAFSCSLLVLMVLVVGVGVFLRYILRSPLVAGMNMATLMLVWLTFFGASSIYKHKGHIAIEFVVKYFPNQVKQITSFLVYLTIAVTLIVSITQAVSLLKIQRNQQIVALGIPRSFLSLPLIITGICMFITTVRHLVAEVSQLSNRERV